MPVFSITSEILLATLAVFFLIFFARTLIYLVMTLYHFKWAFDEVRLIQTEFGNVIRENPNVIKKKENLKNTLDFRKDILIKEIASGQINAEKLGENTIGYIIILTIGILVDSRDLIKLTLPLEFYIIILVLFGFSATIYFFGVYYLGRKPRLIIL